MALKHRPYAQRAVLLLVQLAAFSQLGCGPEPPVRTIRLRVIADEEFRTRLDWGRVISERVRTVSGSD